MIVKILDYVSFVFILLSNFFIVASIVGLIRNKDFYVKMHTLSMFNLYGVNFTFFAIGLLNHNPIIFFEMIFIIIINSVVTLVVINCLFRNAILSGVPYKAKTRDDVVEEQTRKMKEAELERRKNRETDRIKEENKQKAKEVKKRYEEERKLKSKEVQNKKQQTVNKNVNNANNTNNIQQNKSTIKPNVKPPVIKEEQPNKGKMSDIERENEELRKKIKEQKAILRKKIETMRKKAFITRKPEEIQKAEDTINEILTKYNLTEDMLKDDDEY